MLLSRFFWLFFLCGVQYTNGETYTCDDASPCVGDTMECVVPDEPCNVACFGTGVCEDAVININGLDVTSAVFNVTCEGADACKNLKLRSYRQGKMTCLNPDDIFDGSLDTCFGIDVSIIDSFGVTGASELECKGFVCENIRIYSDDPQNFVFRCAETDGCSTGTIDWYCNGGNCRLRGTATAFQSSTGATIYCDPNTQGIHCEDPMPDSGIQQGWTYGSTNFPSSAPTIPPTAVPTDIPSQSPTRVPTDYPSDTPTNIPSNAPTRVPTNVPSQPPTRSPSNLPSATPSSAPTDVPTNIPSNAPSSVPSGSPSQPPSAAPSRSPSQPPTNAPSRVPSQTPSDLPSAVPSRVPSTTPTIPPSNAPSLSPSSNPSNPPTDAPFHSPTNYPSQPPSRAPSQSPSLPPTAAPSLPTESPSVAPSNAPTPGTAEPSNSPSVPPSRAPTGAPTPPTLMPTAAPSLSPSAVPSSSPSTLPSSTPTNAPTQVPSLAPSSVPSGVPSSAPSSVPSLAPSRVPTNTPSIAPSQSPSQPPTGAPSLAPSRVPTGIPSAVPSAVPSLAPSVAPSNVPTGIPSAAPSRVPSSAPSSAPTTIPSGAPSSVPSLAPSRTPSDIPSGAPSSVPSLAPSNTPTDAPSRVPSQTPSLAPSSAPSLSPSRTPTEAPSLAPSNVPSDSPTRVPSQSPSAPPTRVPSQSPSIAPTEAPTLAPSFAPTVRCVTMDVQVHSLPFENGTYPEDVWSGFYYQSDELFFSRPVWYQDTGDSNFNFLKYIGGGWVLRGESNSTGDSDDLTYQDNSLFPPLDTNFWDHGDYEDSANVSLYCDETFVPTAIPSEMPTQKPTFSPTEFCPIVTMSKTVDFVGADMNDSIYDIYNISMLDSFDSEVLISGWHFFDSGEQENDRDTWEYSGSTYDAEMYYDGEDWTLEVYENGMNGSLVFQIWLDPDIYHDGKHPPFVNETDWYTILNDSVSFASYQIICYTTLVPTDVPTNAPFQSPSSSPSAEPTTAPTNAPVLSPTDVPSSTPSAEPTNDPTTIPTTEPTATTMPPTNMPTQDCEVLRVTVMNITGNSDVSESDLEDDIDGGYLQADTLLFGRTWFTRTYTNDGSSTTSRISWQNGDWVLAAFYDTLRIEDSGRHPPAAGFWDSSSFDGQYYIETECDEATFDPTSIPTNMPSTDPTAAPTDDTDVPTVSPTNLPSDAPTLKPTPSGDTIIAGDGEEAAFGLTWFYLVLILIGVLLIFIAICVYCIRKINKDAAENRLVTHTARQSRAASNKSVDQGRSAANSQASAGLNLSVEQTAPDAVMSASPSGAAAQAPVAYPPSPLGKIEKPRKSSKAPKSPKGASPQEVEMVEQQARDRANTNFVEEEDAKEIEHPTSHLALAPPPSSSPKASQSLDGKLTDALAVEMASEDQGFANALANAHRKASMDPEKAKSGDTKGNDDFEDDALDI